MIGIWYWDEANQTYRARTWPVRFNEPVNGEVDEESYWLAHWGVNPFEASKGYFAPEWN